MIFDLQKASLLKRVSAFVLDFILLVTLAVGGMFLVQVITGYDNHQERYNGYLTDYSAEYGVDLFLSDEDYQKMTDAERKEYNEKLTQVETALQSDKNYIKTYYLLISLMLVSISIGVLLSVTVLEFIIPLVLKNGQTVGKKVFGLGVMRTEGIKLQPILLFVRTYLGKYAIEIMAPIFIIAMIVIGILGLIGTIVLIGLLVLQIIVMCYTNTNSMIHDLISDTVVIDITSQMIFEDEKSRIEYIEQKQRELAEKQRD